MEIKKQEFW